MDTLSRLVDALRCLPGVGPKSAQRMVYHLLKHQRQRGLNLAACLEQAMRNIRSCNQCNNYSDLEICSYCSDSLRDTKTLCVVESPGDIAAIEQNNVYKGGYFVLMGKISPLDGLGPEEIHLPKLKARVTAEGVEEIIIALSPSVEGHTTIHFIQQMLKELPVRITQLAHGIPSGGELEYLDGHTIVSALRNRALVE